ncbi:hypothetical protein BS17DRAFT_820345 [Gyrodon lividus]|nr:hypothetical protein BS17DRAFT_820345 [Gyrodon lividus]
MVLRMQPTSTSHPTELHVAHLFILHHPQSEASTIHHPNIHHHLDKSTQRYSAIRSRSHLPPSFLLVRYLDARTFTLVWISKTVHHRHHRHHLHRSSTILLPIQIKPFRTHHLHRNANSDRPSVSCRIRTSEAPADGPNEVFSSRALRVADVPHHRSTPSLPPCTVQKGTPRSLPLSITPRPVLFQIVILFFCTGHDLGLDELRAICVVTVHALPSVSMSMFTRHILRIPLPGEARARKSRNRL